MLTSLAGSYAGSMLGGRVGGMPGSLIGSIAGSVLGANGASGTASIIHDLEAKAQNVVRDHNQHDTLVTASTHRATKPSLSASAELAGLDDADAEVLITMMVNAAKADGQVDQTETDSIITQLGDLDDEEKRYLANAFTTPFVDAATLAATTPSRLAEHAYTVSVLAISANELSEKRYLLDLAQALGITDDRVADLNLELGATI